MARGVGEPSAQSALGRRGKGGVGLTTAQKTLLLLQANPADEKAKFDALTADQLLTVEYQAIEDFVSEHGIEPLLPALSAAAEIPEPLYQLLIQKAFTKEEDDRQKAFTERWLHEKSQQLWQQYINGRIMMETGEVELTKAFVYPELETVAPQLAQNITEKLSQINWKAIDKSVVDNLLQHIHENKREQFSIEKTLKEQLDEETFRLCGRKYMFGTPYDLYADFEDACQEWDPYGIMTMSPEFSVNDYSLDMSKDNKYTAMDLMETVAHAAFRSKPENFFRFDNTSLSSTVIEEMASWNAKQRKQVASMDGDPDEVRPRQTKTVAKEGQVLTPAKQVVYHVSRATGWTPQQTVEYCHRAASAFLEEDESILDLSILQD